MNFRFFFLVWMCVHVHTHTHIHALTVLHTYTFVVIGMQTCLEFFLYSFLILQFTKNGWYQVLLISNEKNDLLILVGIFGGWQWFLPFTFPYFFYPSFIYVYVSIQNITEKKAVLLKSVIIKWWLRSSINLGPKHH